MRYASCRCLAWLTFLTHPNGALRDDVQPLGSPRGSPQMNLKSKNIHNLRPE